MRITISIGKNEILLKDARRKNLEYNGILVVNTQSRTVVIQENWNQNKSKIRIGNEGSEPNAKACYYIFSGVSHNEFYKIATCN